MSTATPTATAPKVKIESPTALKTCVHIPVPAEEAAMARAKKALLAFNGHMTSALRAVESDACDAHDLADKAMETIVKLQKTMATMQTTITQQQTTITQLQSTIAQLTDRVKAVEEEETDDEDYKRRVQDARQDIAKSVVEQLRAAKKRKRWF